MFVKCSPELSYFGQTFLFLEGRSVIDGILQKTWIRCSESSLSAGLWIEYHKVSRSK